MQLNLESLTESLEKITNSRDFIDNFINEIGEKLNKMENVKEYTIDRFEGDYAVCEDRDTQAMINIKKENLPENIKEGSIIKCKNNEYYIDEEKQNEESNRIKEKMDKLWKN